MRLEIADALRVGAQVVPVLVDDADMPAPEELPADIRIMSDVNALRLRDSD